MSSFALKCPEFRESSGIPEHMMMSSSSNQCFGSASTVAPGKNKPEINRPGMSLGLTTLIPPREQSKLNRLDEHLERGKERFGVGSSLGMPNHKPTVDFHKVLQTGYFLLVNFDSFANSYCRGPEVFLAKIGNMDKDHPNFLSFSNFLNLSHSTFRPRLIHAFVNIADFPARFSDFRNVILTKLELPRNANVSFAIHCDFFGAIHSLDEDRYRSVLIQWKANGRPLEIFKRKIYVLCDWESVVR